MQVARTLPPREGGEVAPVGRVAPGDVLSFDRAVGPALAGETGDHVDDVGHGHVDALLDQRGHGPVTDPARHDVLAQVRHVGRDVEGEAVHRAAVAQAHADRRDLARDDRRIGMIDVEPHTGEALEATGVRQAQLGERIDDQAFDAAHVVGRAEPVADVEDRVPDELAGAVVRDVAAAFDRDEFGADRGGFTTQVVLEVGSGPVGEHVRMFEQQQMLLVAVLEQRRLDRQRLAIGDAPEPADVQRRVGHQPGTISRTPSASSFTVRSTSPWSRGSP